MEHFADCFWYPEICDANRLYARDKSKAKVERIKDGTKQYKKLSEQLSKRIKNKEWKKIYPLNNHDFDYKELVKNKYNVYKLGITNKPNMSGLTDATLKLQNYMDLMLEKPVPGPQTVAGVDDINEIHPKIKNAIKNTKVQTANMPLPYPSFKKDFPEKQYPTKGKYASSYFVNVGTCKSSINNASDCKSKGFTWVPTNPVFSNKLTNFFSTIGRKKEAKPQPKGTCFKPKFIYVDNKAKGFLNFQGMGLALANDVDSVSPDKLFAILAGYSTGGGGVVPCKEGFKNMVKTSSNLINLLGFLIMCIVIYFIFKRFIN